MALDIGSELLDFLEQEIDWSSYFTRPYNAFACISDLESVVGNQIAHFREQMHLTQAQLAEKMNVDPSTISRHERGMNLQLYHLSDYAKVFGIKEYELINIDNNSSCFSQTIRRFQLLHNLSDKDLLAALDAVESILRLRQQEVLKNDK